MDRLFREKRRKTSTYRSAKYQFAMRYPASWEVIEGKRSGSEWDIPIGWGSRPTPEGRAALLVNVREEALLNRTPPASPKEYLAIAKSSIPFKELRIESEEVTEVGGLEATRLVYSYRGPRSRIREMTVTVFGPRATYQFVCEAPEVRFAEHREMFESCIASFALGTEPAEGPPVAAAAATSHQTSIGFFNEAAGQFAAGRFDESERTFQRAWDAQDSSEALKMVAAYARAICLGRLSRPAETPERLAGQTGEAGCAYLAYTAAGHLVNDGHRVAISSRDLYHVEALIGAERFRLQFTSLFGQFILNAWRIESGKSTSLLELREKPGAPDSVRYLDSILKKLRGGVPPPVKIPEGGFPENL